MNGLRFSLVLLIGLSLGFQVDAGVIMNDGGQANLHLEFASADLLPPVSPGYTPLAIAPKPTGLVVRDRRAPTGILASPGDGTTDGLADILFASQFQLGASPETLPGPGNDPAGLIGITFRGTGLDTGARSTTGPTTSGAKATETPANARSADISDTLAVMPTPASLTLIGLGLIGLGYQQRRRFLARGRQTTRRLRAAASH